jgi:hypothetical protein
MKFVIMRRDNLEFEDNPLRVNLSLEQTTKFSTDPIGKIVGQHVRMEAFQVQANNILLNRKKKLRKSCK